MPQWDVNWPEVLIGFSLGLIPTLWPPVYAFFRYTRTQNQHRMVGAWHLYYASPNGRNNTPTAQATVKYSFWKKQLRMNLRMQGSANTTHGGFLTFRGGLISGYLPSELDREPISLILNDDARAQVDIFSGLILGLDQNYTPIAGPALLSRSAISPENIRQRIAGFSTIRNGYVRAER